MHRWNQPVAFFFVKHLTSSGYTSNIDRIQFIHVSRSCNLLRLCGIFFYLFLFRHFGTGSCLFTLFIILSATIVDKMDDHGLWINNMTMCTLRTFIVQNKMLLFKDSITLITLKQGHFELWGVVILLNHFAIQNIYCNFNCHQIRCDWCIK